MNGLQITQQDAKALAAGYSRWFRLVEVISILTFFAMMAELVRAAAPFAISNPWITVGAAALGFVLADFGAGVVHWAADTFGATDLPILGAAVIRPFREHHVDPKAMTHHDYIETNGANCLVAIPVAMAALAIPLDSTSAWFGVALFAAVSLGSMIFWVMMTNQFHKWAHMDPQKVHPAIQWAQRSHLILPPTQHARHHQAPFETYYCITTGWLNYPLERIGFFRTLERIVIAITGALPRRDDIGTSAAIQRKPNAQRN